MPAIVFNNDRSSQLSKFEKLKIWRLMKFLTTGITGSKTWDAPSVASGASTTTTVTVTGAKVGDDATADFSLGIPQYVSLNAAVTSANTVTVTLTNNSGAALDLASGTLTARIEDRTRYQN